jgi:hypothetical protein
VTAPIVPERLTLTAYADPKIKTGRRPLQESAAVT